MGQGRGAGGQGGAGRHYLAGEGVQTQNPARAVPGSTGSPSGGGLELTLTSMLPAWAGGAVETGEEQDAETRAAILDLLHADAASAADEARRVEADARAARLMQDREEREARQARRAGGGGGQGGWLSVAGEGEVTTL